MTKQTFFGRVKFYDPQAGLGVIVPDDVRGEVRVSVSVIDVRPAKQLAAGDPVEFRYEETQDEGWRYRATWVRNLSEKQIHRGRVKFFKLEKGWGGIESDETPGDVWVHYSAIDGPGFRGLEVGDEVEFRYEPGHQDSWRYVATWVRKLT